MADWERDKSCIIRIHQILKDYTDREHPLTQQGIINKLNADYGLGMDRKSVSRNLGVLESTGVNIKHLPRKGYYLAERDFSDAELRMLIDGVLSSKHISGAQSSGLIERLSKQSNIYFKSHVKHVATVNDWDKTGNEALFDNIELIDRAIESKRQIAFDYNKYGVDKKMHKSSSQCVTPYQLILHNQKYYLMAHNEKWNSIGYLRLDHMSNMSITDKKALMIRDLKGYADGINYKKFNSQMPYMFSDDPVNVSFIADEGIVDQVIDWFGRESIRMSYLDEEKKKVKVSLICSPTAMKYWALSYADHVTVTEPEELRSAIRESLKSASDNYSIKYQ